MIKGSHLINSSMDAFFKMVRVGVKGSLRSGGGGSKEIKWRGGGVGVRFQWLYPIYDKVGSGNCGQYFVKINNKKN